MKKTTKTQTTAEPPRNVVMVAYPDAHILDVVGPLEILTGSKLFLPEEIDPYHVALVAHDKGPVSTTSGLTLQADYDFNGAKDQLTEIDTLIISGGHGTGEAINDSDLLEYVSWAGQRAKRIVSICTGAMILAELGLLDGKRATTHWWWCPILAQRYPKVEIDPDAIYIQDGNIWTSAGVTTGMDLALALVEADWGHEVALQVARYNVMYMMRPGGQSQFSTQLIAQTADDSAIAETLKYILGNVKEDLNVTKLAARAAMSERSFARKFKDETSITPANYVEMARLQAARVELEQTDHPVEVVAINAGFVNPERMRRAFQRHLGIAASEYRERFKPHAAKRKPLPNTARTEIPEREMKNSS